MAQSLEDEVWKRKINEGKLSEVVDHISKNLHTLKPETAILLFATLGRFLTKNLNDTVEFNINPEDIVKMILMCGRNLDLIETQDDPTIPSQKVKTLLNSMHCALYFLFTKNFYESAALLAPMTAKIVSLVCVVPSEDKESFHRAAKEVATILWNTSINIKKKNSEPTVMAGAMEVCCHSLFILSQVQPSNLKLILARMTVVFSTYNNISAVRPDLLGYILTQSKMQSVNLKDLTIEENEAVETLLSEVSKALVTKNVNDLKRDLQDLEKLQWLLSDKQLRCWTQAVEAFATLNSSLPATEMFITLRKSFGQLQNPSLLSSAIVKMSVKVSKENPERQKDRIESFQAVQELLLQCVPLVKEKVKILACCTIMELQEACSSTDGLSISVQAMSVVDQMCELAVEFLNGVDSNLGTEVYNLMSNTHNQVLEFLNAKNCQEALRLAEWTSKMCYSVGSSFTNSPKYFERVLEILIHLKRATRPLIVSETMQKDKIKEAHINALMVIKFVTYGRSVLAPELYTKMLQSAAKLWAETLIVMNTNNVVKTKHESMMIWWNKYDESLSQLFSPLVEPDWEELLTLEISCYSNKEEHADLIYAAGKALRNRGLLYENLLHWTTGSLAVAQAQSFQEGEGPSLAVETCTEVLNRLQNEVDAKAIPLEVINFYQAQAQYQTFICEQSVQRKEWLKLAEIPLTTRAPTRRNNPDGESLALESWEEGHELSQLGQVLSCRKDCRAMSPLLTAVSLMSQALCRGLSKTSPVHLKSGLLLLESSAYYFASAGDYWMATKTWSVLYQVGKIAECPQVQLLSISQLMVQYRITPGSAEEKWINENTEACRLQLELQSEENKEAKYILTLNDLCCARNLMLANKNEEAADIVMNFLHQNDSRTLHPSFLLIDLLVRARLLASQLMVRLPNHSQQRKRLLKTEMGPMEAASWAVKYSHSMLSWKFPGERWRTQHCCQDLMIQASEWLAYLAFMLVCYRTACCTLQSLLQEVQRLLLPTRTARVLACIGDLDLMTPDEEQLNHRLFWNRKILSLGKAIEGGATPMPNSKTPHKTQLRPPKTYTAGSSPTRFRVKSYQLTAACSERCSSLKFGCALCKNPLYQLCKAHFAYLADNNEEAFFTLCNQLKETYKERSSRLWTLTWAEVMGVKEGTDESLQGWTPMLLAPITLLECRMQLAVADQLAEKDPDGAVTSVNSIIKTLRSLEHEGAPLLLNWAINQLVSHQMQIRGLGPFSEKLKQPESIMGLLTEVNHLSLQNVCSTPVKTEADRTAVKKVPGRPRRKLLMPEVSVEDLSPMPTLKPAPKLTFVESASETGGIFIEQEESEDTSSISPTIQVNKIDSVTKQNIIKASSKENISENSENLEPVVKTLAKKTTRVYKKKTATIGKCKAKPLPAPSTDASPTVSTKTTRTKIVQRKVRTATLNHIADSKTQRPTYSESDDSPLIVDRMASEKKSKKLNTSSEESVITETNSVNSDSPLLKMKSYYAKKLQSKILISSPEISPISVETKAKSVTCTLVSKRATRKPNITKPAPNIKDETKITIKSSKMKKMDLNANNCKSTSTSSVPLLKAKTVSSSNLGTAKHKTNDVESDVSIVESSIIVEEKPVKPTRPIRKGRV